MAGSQILSLPAAVAGVAPISSASAWVFGSAVTISASLVTGIYVLGLTFQNTDTPATDTNQDVLFELTVNGVTKLQFPFNVKADTLVGYHFARGDARFYLPESYFIQKGSAVAVQVTDSIAAALTYDGVKIIYQESLPALSFQNYMGIDVGDGLSVTEKIR